MRVRRGIGAEVKRLYQNKKALELTRSPRRFPSERKGLPKAPTTSLAIFRLL